MNYDSDDDGILTIRIKKIDKNYNKKISFIFNITFFYFTRKYLHIIIIINLCL